MFGPQRRIAAQLSMQAKDDLEGRNTLLNPELIAAINQAPDNIKDRRNCCRRTSERQSFWSPDRMAMTWI
jgi:hypothetical protein